MLEHWRVRTFECFPCIWINPHPCKISLDLFANSFAKGIVRWFRKAGFIYSVALISAALLILAPGEGASEELCFDGSSAFSHLRALVEIGPRPPDSPGAKKAQEYIVKELSRQGLEVREQPFAAHTPLGPKKMKNIIGVVPGQTKGILVIGTHYDTKLIEGIPFIMGANDGGSGTAVLLELARCLEGHDSPLTIWLVFFDGEEAFVKWGRDDSLYGSRHMIGLLNESGEITNVKAMVLLDMIGDSHLSIESEMLSTPWLKRIVWAGAMKLGHGKHFTDNACRIMDDHVPFLEQGIPSIDIIDFHYGPGSRTNEYWHTVQDNLDHVSPISLTIVGNVVLESIPHIAEHIAGD